MQLQKRHLSLILCLQLHCLSDAEALEVHVRSSGIATQDEGYLRWRMREHYV